MRGGGQDLVGGCFALAALASFSPPPPQIYYYNNKEGGETGGRQGKKCVTPFGEGQLRSLAKLEQNFSELRYPLSLSFYIYICIYLYIYIL